jgi:hypothetical protein
VAYFGVFGVAGSVYSAWLAPLTGLWLGTTVAAMAWGARGRYGAVLLAGAGAISVAAGKFLFVNRAVVYAGIAALLAAAVWRAWPAPGLLSPASLPCDECAGCPAPRKENEFA